MGQGNNIKKLTIITVIILSGIVALQFYWLLTSYQQQQQRFDTDINNALASTNANLLMQKAMSKQPGAIRKLFGADGAPANGNLSRKTISDERTGNVLHLVNSVVKLEDSITLKSLKAFFDSTLVSATDKSYLVQLRFNLTDSDLVDYKKAYARELKARHIDIPFDLALVDSTDSIHSATCAIPDFKAYSFKSSFNELPGTQGQFGLVAGSYNPNYYVLHNMLWILIITMTLIILGSWSLGYLLLTFFRQEKVAEIRNDFMNNMTHELKTPISSISLAFEMALDDELPLSREKRTSYLRSAQKETTRLKMIVENVLKILSLEKAEPDIIKSGIAVRPWLSAIIERINPLLEQKNVTIRTNIEPASLEMYADETHISNVIYNILENAIKYNDKPTPHIKISISGLQDYIQFSILDNGAGIQEKYLDKIFEKFFRVPKDNLHDVKGYGLGLSYVKSVVEMHGGTIAVRSIAGKETEFIIQLPSL